MNKIPLIGIELKTLLLNDHLTSVTVGLLMIEQTSEMLLPSRSVARTSELDAPCDQEPLLV